MPLLDRVLPFLLLEIVVVLLDLDHEDVVGLLLALNAEGRGNVVEVVNELGIGALEILLQFDLGIGSIVVIRERLTEAQIILQVILSLELPSFLQQPRGHQGLRIHRVLLQWIPGIRVGMAEVITVVADLNVDCLIAAVVIGYGHLREELRCVFDLRGVYGPTAVPVQRHCDVLHRGDELLVLRGVRGDVLFMLRIV